MDEGYIQGILIGVKSAEEASREAKDAQKDIDDTIKALQKTVNKLKSFKEQINKYEHLDDVDQIWEDLNNVVGDLGDVSDRLLSLDEYIKEELTILKEFKTQADSQKHIWEIDDIWKRLKTAEDSLSSAKKAINQNVEHIANGKEELYKLKSSLDALEHLNDIDDMWKNIQDAGAQQSKCMSDIERLDTKVVFIDEMSSLKHVKDIDDEWEFSHSISTNVDKLSSNVEKHDGIISEYEKRLQEGEDSKIQLTHKLKIAYIIAGSALGLSLLQMILSLVGVF